jgi:hypothetical protein
MDISLRAIVSMEWSNIEQPDLHHFKFECGPACIRYEVSRRLSGWGTKMMIRANDIIIFEAHIVPRRGPSDTALINAWDLMTDKMHEAKTNVVNATRALAYEDISDWVADLN